MAYEQKDNSGSLFKNDRKENDKQPDYKGTVKIGGVEYWQSAWIKDVNGKKFFSQSFTPKDANPEQKKTQTLQFNSDPGDDLPF